MTDDRDVLALLVDYHDHISAPAALVADDVRRGRRRVRRNRALVTSGVALGVACVVAVVSVLTGGVKENQQEPAVPTPTPVPTVVNGEVGEAEKRFPAAESIGYAWRAFDPVADRALYVCEDECADGGAARFVVVARRGTLADVPAWPLQGAPSRAPGPAALGPGPDELTLGNGGRTLRVVGYDGKLRRTIDLAASLGPEQHIARLAWSSDGALAVVTGEQVQERASVARVWFVDRGERARLAYSILYYNRHKDEPALTLRGSDYDARGYIWGLGGWSPDGQALLLDVFMQSRSLGVGPRVVVLRRTLAGTARPATAKVIYESTRHFDWAGNVAWSPDGTRIAARTKGFIVEISATDGRVLAQLPHLDGWLVWPRADR